MMDMISLAQYGIAGLALVIVGYMLGTNLMQRSTSEAIAEALEPIKQLVKNNTDALKELSCFMQGIQVSLAKQETKLDELLERMRRSEN